MSATMPRWRHGLSALGLVVIGALAVSGCGGPMGPDYGADPVESRELAIPPDLTAQPLATQASFPDLPSIEELRPGPRSAEAPADWEGRLEGNVLTVPVPTGWAAGAARAALLLRGVDVAEERSGMLRTDWLNARDHRHLGVSPPADGRIRYTLEIRSESPGVSQVLAQAARRNGDEVSRAQSDRVNQFLKALQPAFGKQR